MSEFVTGERRSFYTDRDSEHDHDRADFDRVVRMLLRTDPDVSVRTARQRVANFAPGYVKELAMLSRRFGMRDFATADHWVSERRYFGRKVDALNLKGRRLSKRYCRFLHRHGTILSAIVDVRY